MPGKGPNSPTSHSSNEFFDPIDWAARKVFQAMDSFAEAKKEADANLEARLKAITERKEAKEKVAREQATAMRKSRHQTEEAEYNARTEIQDSRYSEASALWKTFLIDAIHIQQEEMGKMDTLKLTAARSLIAAAEKKKVDEMLYGYDDCGQKPLIACSSSPILLAPPPPARDQKPSASFCQMGTQASSEEFTLI